MKIRNGFVSNSSSSSYVILIDVEEYQKKLAETEGYMKAAVEYMFGETTVIGNKYMFTEYTTGNYNSFVWCDEQIEAEPVEEEKKKWKDEYYYISHGAYEDFMKTIDKAKMWEHRIDD